MICFSQRNSVYSRERKIVWCDVTSNHVIIWRRRKAIINLSNKTCLNELWIDTFNHNHILRLYACATNSCDACSFDKMYPKLTLFHLHIFSHFDRLFFEKISFCKRVKILQDIFLNISNNVIHHQKCLA